MATAALPKHGRRHTTGGQPDSAHDDVALLRLVGEVAEAAADDPAERVKQPERVSVRAFNRVKLDVDRARRIADPRNDPNRIPSAHAILMRFNKRSGDRDVAWAEIVAAGLLDDPTMWLSALRREAPAKNLDEDVVTFALQRVASELETDRLSHIDYARTRDRLVAEDRERFGEEGVLSGLLPTVNQIEGVYGFAASLKSAGLKSPAKPRPRPAGTGSERQARGLPLSWAAALYGALNGTWPSKATLRAFAASAGFMLADTTAVPATAMRTEAAKLLQAEGVPVPKSHGARGRGKRLRYRYPSNGLPGAPTSSRDSGVAAAARTRELYVLGLRVWLAELRSSDRRSRQAYVAWRAGTEWPSPAHFGRFGGFSALKAAAEQANEHDRLRHGERLPFDPDARRDELQHERRCINGSVDSQTTFKEMLEAVLTGTCVETMPPKQ